MPGATAPQTPPGEAVFLDHVGWFVADLDAAAATLNRLGFAVSPENVHMNRASDGSQAPSGTVNRLATPAIGYLEFLGARGDTPLARQHAAQLARYEGLHLMAFSSADVPAEAARLAREGFRPLEPIDMRRDVATADGPREARFSVLRVPPGVMAEGRVQWCAHFTPDLVWRAGLTDHANGALALSGALWLVADLDEALDRYSRFLRKPARRLAVGVGDIALERGALVFATPDAAPALLPGVAAPSLPYGAGVGVSVRDLAATAAMLAASGVAFAQAGHRLILPPTEALGAWLIFHTDGAPFA